MLETQYLNKIFSNFLNSFFKCNQANSIDLQGKGFAIYKREQLSINIKKVSKMSKLNNEIEEWRDVPNYEGYYQASNLGRIRSLDRWITFIDGRKRFYKGMIIEGVLDKGYRRASLNKDDISKAYKISQLVSMAFLGHKPDGNSLVVDHIDGDRLNDKLVNLRIVTHRANLSTCFRSDKDSFSSKHIGVCWSKGDSKWMAQIQFNGKDVYLGIFADEMEASIAYQSALSKIKDGSFNPDDYKPKFTSRHKGVSFYKTGGKWQANITINGKYKHLGYFSTELEAYHAYQDKLKEPNK